MSTSHTDAPAQLPIETGARSIPDRATFELLARRDDVPGQLAAEECKLLILGVDTPSPQLYFLNTKTFAFHWDFATRGLGLEISNRDFNAITYFRDDRSNLAGTIIANDRYEPAGGGEPGLYALEFWPTDPVRAPHVAVAYDLVGAAMAFAAGRLAYHPAGDTQEALFAQDAAQLQQLGVRSISTQELFANVAYVALNPGEGFGVLTAVDPTTARPPTIRDVALFATLPNDLGHVAGVISATPQTPLSHINLKAKQNDTPNAYVRDAATHERIAPLVGRIVRYEVGAEDFALAPATAEEVAAWLERIRPAQPQTPPRDLSLTEITDLTRLGHGDAQRVGAKAANVAELLRMLPHGVAPDGYAIPFGFYDRFMRDNGLYDDARELIADPDTADPAQREEKLAKLRKKIKQGDIADEDEAALLWMQANFGLVTPIRCRSSTNNEDLEGFNGAGLYDSFTHRPDEGDLSKTIKQVWASLWNLRAFDERDFHRIDHLAAAMGVLVHENYDDELANGVAVTKNPYDPFWPGFYVNVQVGESLVTNPDPSAVPDELLISAIGEHGEYETQYIRRSTLTEDGATVMTAEQIAELTKLLATIQERFKALYGKQDDPGFAMDVEFKVDRHGQLAVKQARPWVE
ncbi:MAG: PEP/pyruvate-binding domain-containing protein [Solirubrobacteraceae bacterium]|nr:PEP/pyruvate-binding domain-containing protein [Solirubrobacteraceae bacterium]